MAERSEDKREEPSNGKDESDDDWLPRLKPFALTLPHAPAAEEREEDDYILEDQIWLPKEEYRAPEFLELFYDLVFVAVLSVFSTTHEVSSAQSVIVYFSYFVIIWWTWVSQILYDVHFQMDDWLHRLFKCAQLGIFAFLGATAADFTPFEVVPSSDVTTAGIEKSDAASSYSGVATVYAIGRCLLVVQYVIIAVRLRFGIKTTHTHFFHLHKPVPKDTEAHPGPVGPPPDDLPKTRSCFGWFFEGYFRWIAFPAVIYSISALLWFIGAYAPASGPIKIALPYAALTLEMASTIIGLPHRTVQSLEPPARLIQERSTALTLIILGEGIIGLIRSFSFVIAGFGFTPAAYGQCICALIVVFASWHFLFHNLGPSSKTGVRKRWRRMWLFMHLPLHFCILLMFAGIRNAGTYGNINIAIGTAEQYVDDVYKALQLGELGFVQPQNDWLTTQLGKLDMQTPWQTELQKLNETLNEATYPHDAKIQVLSYKADICVAITTSFQIELSDDVMALYATVANLNDTWVKNDLQQIQTETNDSVIYQEFFDAYSSELEQGILFLFPASGGVLLQASLMVLLRARPRGRSIWTYWLLQVAVGLGLCLLGFLDDGPKDITVNGEKIIVYQLLEANWMLPILAITYAGLIIVECTALVVAFHKMAKEKEKAEAALLATGLPPPLQYTSNSYMSMRSEKREEKQDGDIA